MQDADLIEKTHEAASLAGSPAAAIQLQEDVVIAPAAPVSEPGALFATSTSNLPVSYCQRFFKFHDDL